MTDSNHVDGHLNISPTAVSTIANQAIHQSYGVVSMASKNFVNGIAERLNKDNHRGIDITIEEDGITVDAYIIVEYGIRIRSVAESVQNTVKYNIEKTTGKPVKAVNVYVHGVRKKE